MPKVLEVKHSEELDLELKTLEAASESADKVLNILATQMLDDDLLENTQISTSAGNFNLGIDYTAVDKSIIAHVEYGDDSDNIFSDLDKKFDEHFASLND